MKKFLLLLGLLCAASLLPAQEESLIFIHPGRETFVYFPSAALGSTNTVTFFLPEDFVPLQKSYPLVVALGVVPKQAAAVASFQQHNPAIVVGVNFEEKDYVERAAQIEQFLTRELLPYVDTNYLTKTGPENRILAVQGKSAVQIALRVAQNPNLFGALALFSTADVWETSPVPAVRTLITGTQAELALAQRVFEQHGRTYGPDFALRYAEPTKLWFETIDTDYLWAPAQKTRIKYLRAAVSENKISLASPQEVFLRVWAVLENNSLFHYVAPSLRVSPPFLTWDPARGALRVVSGATAGTVRVRNIVDKPGFSVKIKLKK